MDKWKKLQPQIEASAAAAENWIEHDYEEDEHPTQPEFQPELINIEFSRLATYFMRAAKNDPKLAHKKAWEFLKAGFNYFPPPLLSADVVGVRLRKQLRPIEAERRAWGIDREPLIPFAEAALTDWCRHKTPPRIKALLKRVGYLEPFLSRGEINRPAYEVALQRDKERRKEQDAKRRREGRKNKGKRESPGKPLQ